MAAAAAASSSAAVPPADAAGHADDYQVNDIIQVKIRGVDKRFSQLHASYHCLIIATSPTHITFHPLYWSTDIYTIRRGHAKVRPLQPSDALSAYTGPPERKIAQIRSAVLPPLPPVATHSHHLQRFAFDFLWSCSECGKETGASEAQAYSCLPCHYDLCVDCFVAQGGVDTHPLPCVAPPAKRLKFEDYSKITFVDELKELECPSCLSTVCRPPNLLCGEFQRSFPICFALASIGSSFVRIDLLGCLAHVAALVVHCLQVTSIAEAASTICENLAPARSVACRSIWRRCTRSNTSSGRSGRRR
jgi:hypothetical protein